MLHTNELSDSAESKNETTGAQGKTGVRKLNFGMGSEFMSKQTMGADEVAFAKAITMTVKKVEDSVGVHIFSRSSFKQLAYANIVLTLSLGETMTYFNILLEGTGNSDMSANRFMESIHAQERPFVTTDAIDNELQQVVLKSLRSSYPNIKDFVSMEGMVIPANIDLENEKLIHEVATAAYNSCLLELGLISGEIEDIDLAESLGATTGFVKLRQLTLTQPDINILGQQTKVEWAVELSSTNKINQVSPNTLGTENALTSAFGRINFLPEEYVEQVMGIPPMTKTGFHPQIIISKFEQSIPSMGYTLLSIATTAVMTRDMNWIKPILANNETAIDIGVLNKIVNVEGDEKGGKAFNIKNPKLTQEERVGMIMKFASLTPILSLDVVAFGENASVLATFTTAVNGNADASNEIIRTLTEMTRGAFPNNFPITDIFAGKPVIIPEGTWIDKNGMQRTIDDIDTAYILSMGGTNARQLASDYIFSELGLSNDSFVDRVALLQKLGIDAKIHGRKMRLTFSFKFIETMINAFTSCGLNPRFESTELITRPTGLGFTSGMFERSQISGIQAFQPYVPNTGYGNQFGAGNFGMGYNYNR